MWLKNQRLKVDTVRIKDENEAQQEGTRKKGFGNEKSRETKRFRREKERKEDEGRGTEE